MDKYTCTQINGTVENGLEVHSKQAPSEDRCSMLLNEIGASSVRAPGTILESTRRNIWPKMGRVRLLLLLQ